MENTYFISIEYPLMKNNSIPSLLPLEFREQDGESSLYYEITGKESLDQISQKNQFTYEDVCGLLQGFLNLFHELEDYMLSLKQVNFDRKSIFMDYKKNVYWIYGPKIHEDVQSNIEKVFLWLLSFVDPEDGPALRLAHRVYTASKQGGITREFVEQCLKEGREKVAVSKREEKKNEKEVEHDNIAHEVSRPDWETPKKEENIKAGEKKEKQSWGEKISWIQILKIVLLILNLILMGYWIYFLNRYGMQRLILILFSITFVVLSLISASLYRDFLKTRGKRETSIEQVHFSEELRTSNLSTKSIFEELDEYWEKGQEMVVESDCTHQEEPYLYNTSTGKMERMKVFPFYIGSEEGLNQLSISHKTVSRQHAVIVKKQDEQLYVEDLESANGTWVNGNQIFPGTPVLIRNGDRISFGKENFQYCLE